MVGHRTSRVSHATICRCVVAYDAMLGAGAFTLNECAGAALSGGQISPKSELWGFKWENTHNKCVHGPM